jgi:hypothetical protein
VIVEYKEPGTLSPNKEAAPNKAVVDQLKRRFYGINREEHRNWRSMFGVGTEGRYFIFPRFRGGKWTDQGPLGVNCHFTERPAPEFVPEFDCALLFGEVLLARVSFAAPSRV